MKKISVLAFLFIFLFSSVALAAMAVSMAPPNNTFYLKPKKKTREVIELENRGFRPVRLKVYQAGFSIDEEGDLRFTPGEYSAEGWIRLNPEALKISPYDYGVVRYEIRVPEKVAPGSYTASIMVEEEIELPEGEKTAQFMIKGRLAHIIYVHVGKPVFVGRIEGLQACREKEDVKVVFTVINEGDFLFRLKGKLKIQNSEGKTFKELVVPNVPVLRRSRRRIRMTVPNGLSPGTYGAVLSLDIGAKSPLKAKTDFSVAGSD
ncbi:MAG: DUF4148 domain-containing protein [Deltaproteobacteria bacterium]|nr:DUF4148 domain-containing protein [Deltaproteobacteria bacterium]